MNVRCWPIADGQVINLRPTATDPKQPLVITRKRELGLTIFAKILGGVEILIALFAAYLRVSLIVGFVGDDKFAGEWGLLLIPIDFVVAAVFGWAGYMLLIRKTAGWKYQLVPLIAVVLIAAFLIWADSV